MTFEFRVMDVVHKPPFWTNPVRIVSLFKDSDGSLYASVENLDGTQTDAMTVIPMLLYSGSQRHIVQRDIVKVERFGETVFERPERTAEKVDE